MFCKGSWGERGCSRKRWHQPQYLEHTQVGPQKCLIPVQPAFSPPPSNSQIHQHYYSISCRKLEIFVGCFTGKPGQLLGQFAAAGNWAWVGGCVRTCKSESVCVGGGGVAKVTQSAAALGSFVRTVNLAVPGLCRCSSEVSVSPGVTVGRFLNRFPLPKSLFS